MEQIFLYSKSFAIFYFDFSAFLFINEPYFCCPIKITVNPQDNKNLDSGANAKRSLNTHDCFQPCDFRCRRRTPATVFGPW